MIRQVVDRRTKIWFAKKPNFWLDYANTTYKQALSKRKYSLYKSVVFYTKQINLSGDLDKLFNSFTANTKNEIRRAIKEGIVFNTETSFSFEFYNEFAKSKGLDVIRNELDSIRDNVVITTASFESNILSQHVYLVDQDVSRVRLLLSATNGEYSNILPDNKKRVGWANRFLHFQDMKYFKGIGIDTYDLGGYAFNTTDPALANINSFKDSFGGQLVEEMNYYPKRFLKKIISTFKFGKKQ